MDEHNAENSVMKYTPRLVNLFKDVFSLLFTLLAIFFIIKKQEYVWINGFFDLAFPETLAFLLLVFSLALYIHKYGKHFYTTWVEQYRRVISVWFLSFLFNLISRDLNPFRYGLIDFTSQDYNILVIFMIEESPRIIWVCGITIAPYFIFCKNYNFLWSSFLFCLIWIFFSSPRFVCGLDSYEILIYNITTYYFNAYSYPIFFVLIYAFFSLCWNHFKTQPFSATPSN